MLIPDAGIEEFTSNETKHFEWKSVEHGDTMNEV